MSKGWKSFAEWDKSVYTNIYGKPISEDTHGSEGEAQAVCGMLERDGFGGANEHYPIRTWTEKINES